MNNVDTLIGDLKSEERFLTLQWHITVLCDQRCRHCYMLDSETYLDELKNSLSYNQCKKLLMTFTKQPKSGI
jgi:MoaA/NifB/PqqE/SkfB family radical SAM enzyme